MRTYWALVDNTGKLLDGDFHLADVYTLEQAAIDDSQFCEGSSVTEVCIIPAATLKGLVEAVEIAVSQCTKCEGTGLANVYDYEADKYTYTLCPRCSGLSDALTPFKGGDV